MKTVIQNSRGLQLKFQVPADAAEFDALTSPGACVNEANSQIIYRTLLPKAWRQLMDASEQLFGVARPTTPDTDSEGNPIEVGVDDKAFIAAIYAAVSPAEVQTAIQSIIDSWVGFDISKTGRAKKPAPIFYAKAEQIAAKVLAAGNDWSSFIKNSASRGGLSDLAFDPEGNVDLDTLAKRLEEVAAADTML